MAPTGFQFLPRFFKVFVAQFSSDSMEIPVSYHEHIPRRFPKTVILQGPRGCSWNIKTEIRGNEVHFAKGWPKFVEDNNLNDGDFLTFVYNGESIFEVSIYRTDGCKDINSDNEEEEDNVLSGEDTDTCSKAEIKTTIPKGEDKGKSIVEVVEYSHDDEEDSVYSSGCEDADDSFYSSGSEDADDSVYSSDSEEIETETETETDTTSEYKMNKATVKSKKKGMEDTAISARKMVANLKKREAAKNRKKVQPKIINPEAYLDDPKNVHFETNVKNRLYELLVHSQLVKDYSLRFGDYVDYIDEHGKLKATTAKWKDHRVCIKDWMTICRRNSLNKEDRVLCELFRRKDYVYAIKLHIIRGRDL